MRAPLLVSANASVPPTKLGGRHHAVVVLAILCMAVLASFMVACAVGFLTLPQHELFATLLAPTKADASLALMLLNLRPTRASSAFVIGALPLFWLAHRVLRGGNGSSNSADRSLLLLSGVVMAIGFGALVALMLPVAPAAGLRGMVFWLIGDLFGASVRAASWVTLCAALLFVICSARSINLIAMHSEVATMLGVPVGRLRWTLFY